MSSSSTSRTLRRRPTERTGRRGARLGRRGLVRNRQVEVGARAFAGCAGQREASAELRGEAVDHRQAEAGAASQFLGRIEGLDRPGERLGIHAAAGVDHRQPDVEARREPRSRSGADRDLLGDDRQAARRRAWRRGR